MQVFAACWKKWKLILPDKAKVYSDITSKAAKPKGRMNRKDVIEQVYRIGKHGTKDWSTLEEMFANDDDDDGGGGKGTRKTDSQTLKLDYVIFIITSLTNLHFGEGELSPSPSFLFLGF